MSEMIAISVLAIALSVWVLRPLFTKKVTLEAASDEKLDQLVEAKEAVYRSILDLELDHQTGKVSDSEYGAERAKREAEALAILVEIDLSGASVDSLELEIAAARQRLAGGS